MSRSSRAAFPILAGALLAAVVASACGGSEATPVPTELATASPSAAASVGGSPSASPGPSAAGSPGASASPTSGIDIGLPHVDAALEDLLPSTIGEVPLVKYSEPLSTLVSDTVGGERELYGPWLVQFGKTPDDVDVAIATANWTSTTISFTAKAIKVPGASAEQLLSGFSSVASGKGWPVRNVTFVKPVLEVTDPTAAAKGLLGVGYVYAYDGVLYIVVTDDSALLLECLIKLPPTE